VSATLMQGKLRELAALLGHGTAEVFPKQTKIVDPKKGASWINLPYFNAADTARTAVREDGTNYTLADFLGVAERLAVPAEYFSATTQSGGKKEQEPLPDGPPCLNQLIQIGFPDRDRGLFNLGIYMRKAYPSNWAQALETANQDWVSTPLPSEELRRIIGSLGKTEYKYQCQQDPLKPYCNAPLCRRRKFGISDSAEVLVFGEMRKLLTSPPTWFWDVSVGENNGTLELATAELQDPRAVQRRLMEQLNAAPSMPTAANWTKVLQEALKNVAKMDPLPDDSSTEGQFWGLVESFCTGHVRALVMDEILLGKPHTDTAAGRTYFRSRDLLAYLGRQGFKDWKIKEVAKALRTAHGKYDVKSESKILKGKFTNLWSVIAFTAQTQGHAVPESITRDEKQF
jgi:hypothetical protein